MGFAQIDLAYGMPGGGTIAFSRMVSEACPTAFPLTSILHPEGRNNKDRSKYSIFFSFWVKNLLVERRYYPCGGSMNKKLILTPPTDT